ncbi:MAG: beta-ketoacyl-[acyl-carrier-protein] synthase family protein [Thermoanaerobaculia bacterium]
MDDRIAITGMGIVSPLGVGRERTLEAVRNASPGIRALSNFDASSLSCRIGGEIPDAWLDGSDLDHDRFTTLALIAAAEACATLPEESDSRRTGVLIASGLGGGETLDIGYQRLYGRNQARVHPMTIPRAMYNAATSAVARVHQAKGPAFSIVSACASGTHAIGQAALWIKAGLAGRVIAGAADAPLHTGTIRAWESLRVLAPSDGDPGRACRPFSADRCGIVLGEGAAVVVLERMELAKARGAEIFGEIAGFGMSSDAGHVTDPSVDGAARAMEMAMESGRLAPDAIGYVNAHGTATRANDPAETAAIRQVFGATAERLQVSSTKSMHAHAMGASGAIELVLSLTALNEGVIPATINYTVPDPECDLDYVPNAAREGRVDAFLSNSFGFGGLNGVLAVRTKHGL